MRRAGAFRFAFAWQSEHEPYISCLCDFTMKP